MTFPLRLGNENAGYEDEERRNRWNALFDPDYSRCPIPAMVTFSQEEEHKLRLPLSAESIARPPESHLHSRKPTVTSMTSTRITKSLASRRTQAARERLANADHLDDFMRERYRILGILRKGNAPFEREAIQQLLGPAAGANDPSSLLRPGTARDRWARLKEEARRKSEDEDDGSRLSKKQSLYPQHSDAEKSLDTTQEEYGETPEEMKGYRVSFIYFLIGFLCPPFWVIGALYDPPYTQSIQSRNKDLKWRSRARWALFFSMFFIVIGSLTSIIIYREFVGWRGIDEESTKSNVHTPNN
ncbi:hypothetical protein EC973_003373 [Apophysomyces ossiformis]|uniref:Uncharacterized protein n=1 Tax=Apophysomyces ossiformis TaxID=679940 RepID=A0A8H7ERQ4_9FUNG|nr:hypothetical protein EC973_003373 [Apophysomyces ossiformis]